MRRQRILPFAGALLALAACGSTEPDGTSNNPPQPIGVPAQAVSVSVQDNFFSPASALVAVNGTVTWNWVGNGHSVTSDGSPTFSPNAPISNPPTTLGPIVFSTLGTYSYHCTVHGVPGVYGSGQMTGAVFVR